MPKRSRHGLQKVTRERMETRDDFRMQVNLENKLAVAVGYNLLVYLMNKEQASIVRNQQAKAIENVIYHNLDIALRDDRYQFSICRFLNDCVDPEMHADVMKFWRAHGWDPE